MRVRFKKTKDYSQARALHVLLFPNDEQFRKSVNNAMWIGYEETQTPVAFCTARYLPNENSVFLERAGVLPIARGLKLQRRMIKLRENWAKSLGADAVLTYVAHHNHASIVSLIKAGYHIYWPSKFWAGKSVHYFQKSI